MKKIIVILIMIFIETPVFGYKTSQRPIPSIYNTQNNYWNNPYRYYGHPYYYNSFNNAPVFRKYNPVTRIKRYFIGLPTGYTMTPNYNINSNTQNQRTFFEDTPGDEYYYDNGGYYTQNREIKGGGSVTIIND